MKLMSSNAIQQRSAQEQHSLTQCHLDLAEIVTECYTQLPYRVMGMIEALPLHGEEAAG